MGARPTLFAPHWPHWPWSISRRRRHEHKAYRNEKVRAQRYGSVAKLRQVQARDDTSSHVYSPTRNCGVVGKQNNLVLLHHTSFRKPMLATNRAKIPITPARAPKGADAPASCRSSS
jgi:hypothetical protein